jgi:hypothetical protein
VGGSGTLKVTTTFNGGDADDIRQYWKSTSADEIKKSYTNFYANEFPDIQADEYVQFTDHEEENIVTSIERYTIETLWKYDSASQQRVAEFYSRIVAIYLSLPSTKRRVMPTASHILSMLHRLLQCSSRILECDGGAQVYFISSFPLHIRH